MPRTVGINDERTVTRGYRTVLTQPEQRILDSSANTSFREPCPVIFRVRQHAIRRLVRCRRLARLQLRGGQKDGTGVAIPSVISGARIPGQERIPYDVSIPCRHPQPVRRQDARPDKNGQPLFLPPFIQMEKTIIVAGTGFAPTGIL